MNTANKNTADKMITGEFNLIESIRERVNRTQELSEKIFGIGDDCAVYRISDNRYGLFSTDISIENVHFDLRYTPLFNAGYRSMTANISDIFAMGGKPVLALVSLGIPLHFTSAMIDELYDGILACAVKHGTFIAGGDTSKSGELIVNISIYGEASLPVYRKGAEPGDRIYITGNTGLSKLGLEVLSGNRNQDGFSKSVEKHLKPEPCGVLIDSILKEYNPSSMIDISDGLISDLGHICTINNCGFELFDDKIPADGEVRNFCLNNKIKVSEYTLYSGEEYELLFTSRKKIENNKQITHIGNITLNGYTIISEGSSSAIELNGYDHFK
ncbi:MAG TPA: thiamine-phosphate kinase [Spirochaetota bacterium]|nr:thiamine-phosphate kinase [Spirochaetota bacterium]HPS85646.1 thiamine-phosphate kinase [Spirochaetota bacterium]